MTELELLELAILKNTSRPRPEELKKITIHRKIQCSPNLEGDSQVGMILFVGLATMLGKRIKDIMSHVSIEFDKEFNYKLAKFYKLMGTNQRFANKVLLVQNYIRHYGA